MRDPNKVPARILVVSENTIMVKVGKYKAAIKPREASHMPLETRIKIIVENFRKKHDNRDDLMRRMSQLERELNA